MVIRNMLEFWKRRVGVQLDAKRGTRPLLRSPIDLGKAILRQFGRMPVFRQHAKAVSREPRHSGTRTGRRGPRKGRLRGS